MQGKAEWVDVQVIGGRESSSERSSARGRGIKSERSESQDQMSTLRQAFHIHTLLIGIIIHIISNSWIMASYSIKGSRGFKTNSRA